jgi:hypothetical protein
MKPEELEADQSTTSNADIKDWWSYNFTSPYVCVMYRVKH